MAAILILQHLDLNPAGHALRPLRCETGERRVDAIELEDFARLCEKGIGFFLPEFPEGK